MQRMSKVAFIKTEGTKILLIDLSNTRDNAELAKTIDNTISIVAGAREHNSILGLVDFSGMPLDTVKMKLIRKMARHNRPYMKFVALAGITGIKSIIVRLFIVLTGRKNHRVFTSREEAVAWLGEKESNLSV